MIYTHPYQPNSQPDPTLVSHLSVNFGTMSKPQGYAVLTNKSVLQTRYSLIYGPRPNFKHNIAWIL